ncbi:DNA methyltransferase [Novosphingobium sediminicola]|uniref:site-specific DNA-methyltransferase (adenine-specific) n=1 Tax=Novosphingobium sediminicola TaxID=563162 RepID=A0A7W6G797_9SPHN|nr:adenine-specific DNA-methyltransferase [Novosphingobium sediminicola]
MATGITGREQLSEDAITAHVPHRDPHPLPSGLSEPFLDYDNRITKAEALEAIPIVFAARQKQAWNDVQLKPNSFALCDNLAGLSALARSDHKARLIYLDPPYNTGMGFQSRSLQHAYDDNRSTAGYVEFMRRRLILMRECLADDGSIYIHIGHQMLGHLKVVMDDVFGPRNFRNIISRRKCSSKNFTSNSYANIHDYLLFYTKSDDYLWNQPGQKPSDDWINKEYTKVDARGRYKLVPVHAPGTRNGETGRPWKGMNPPPGKHWQYAPSKLDELDADGQIYWSKTGNPRRKVYLGDDKLVPYTDQWDCFRDAHHQSIGITGYPTEKNIDMLRMIVGASSNPGDLVVDPFCGSGTTLAAADDLGRRFIGMDESFTAASATLNRLRFGVKPMGDYVDRPKVDQSFDLFQDLPVATQSPQQATERDFEFLVDRELLASFGEQINDLADL